MDHWTGIITEDWIRAQFVGSIPWGFKSQLGLLPAVWPLAHRVSVSPTVKRNNNSVYLVSSW